MMPPSGKPQMIIPSSQVKPVSMLKPSPIGKIDTDIPKENIEQPYGV